MRAGAAQFLEAATKLRQQRNDHKETANEPVEPVIGGFRPIEPAKQNSILSAKTHHKFVQVTCSRATATPNRNQTKATTNNMQPQHLHRTVKTLKPIRMTP